MAGYYGHSKSNNALAAEQWGSFPIAKAAKIIAEACGISQASARKLCKIYWTGEYHHTSKFYNETRYYDTELIIEEINSLKQALKAIKRLPADYISVINEQYSSGYCLDFESASEEFGLTVDELKSAYYADLEALEIIKISYAKNA